MVWRSSLAELSYLERTKTIYTASPRPSKSCPGKYRWILGTYSSDLWMYQNPYLRQKYYTKTWVLLVSDKACKIHLLDCINLLILNQMYFFRELYDFRILRENDFFGRRFETQSNTFFHLGTCTKKVKTVTSMLWHERPVNRDHR